MLKLSVIEEQINISSGKNKLIVKAIKERIPLTFFYSGNDVKSGYRIKGESVALGLSKKGNLIVRMFVKPPSASKKGFAKHGWRTFRVDRMTNLKLNDNETFDNKRPLYKEGDDNSMTVTYVTTDWTVLPKIEKDVTKTIKPIKQTKQEPIQTKQPVEKPIKQEPTQIKEPETTNIEKIPTQIKPSFEPTNLIDNEIKKYIKNIKGEKFIDINDLNNFTKLIYKINEKKFKDENKLTTNVGEGSRKRILNQTVNDIENYLNKNKIKKDEKNNINEDIQKIKYLINY